MGHSDQTIKCALCGRDETKELFWGQDFLHGTPGKFRVVRCTHCGLIYLNPQPNDQEIASFYPPEYTAYQKQRKDMKMPKKGWPRKIKAYIKRRDPIALAFPRGGKILDIGCGAGQFLNTFKNLGWECYGLEVSSLASQRARALGLQIFTGTLAAAHYPQDFFDVVVLNHTLEHLPHPQMILTELYRILKNQGLLRIYLPNIQSLAAKTFGIYWFNLDLPRHLYHYTPTTLKKMLAQNGFRIKKIKFLSSTAGILGSLQHLVAAQKGLKINLRKNRILCPMLKPWVRLLDLFRMGDSFYMYALK